MERIMLFEDFVNVHLINEGGASGHLMHLYDDNSLSFDELENILISAVEGNLSFEEAPTEKTDGQAISITYIDGQVKFARNKTQLKNPISKDEIKAMFANHSENVKKAFELMSDDLSAAFNKLNAKDLEFFENGKNFINAEIIYSKNPNVINYDGDYIQFHGLQYTDGNGNIIDTSNEYGSKLTNIIKSVEADVQNTFKIISPVAIKLNKINDVNLISNIRGEIAYFKRHGSTIKDLKISYLRDNLYLRFPEFNDIPNDIKDKLYLRWIDGDKKTLNWRSLTKEYPFLKDVESSIGSIINEAISRLDKFIINIGQLILKNAEGFLVKDGSKESQRLQRELDKIITDIKNSGSIDDIEKIDSQLKRMQSSELMPSEGVVFKHNGKLYKFTGNFAPLNQLLGLKKYNR